MTAGAPDPPNVNYLLCEYRKPIKSWRKTWVFVRGWVKSIITSCLCCHNHYGTGLFTVHSVKSNSTDNYELNYEIFKSLRPLVFHLDWWNKVHYVVKLSGSIDNTSQLRAISGSHASIVYKRKVPLEPGGHFGGQLITIWQNQEVWTSMCLSISQRCVYKFNNMFKSGNRETNRYERQKFLFWNI